MYNNYFRRPNLIQKKEFPAKPLLKKMQRWQNSVRHAARTFFPLVKPCIYAKKNYLCSELCLQVKRPHNTYYSYYYDDYSQPHLRYGV
jgi:hypothetical protein